MVINRLINCNLCDTTLNLRMQMGYYDIPFNFNCPNCESIISGKVKVDENDLELTNANIAEVSDWGEYYTVELSAEFPTKKIYMRGKNDIGETPFLRNLSFHSDANEATKRAMIFADYSKTDIQNLISYFNLLLNKKYSVLFPKIEKAATDFGHTPINKINNEFDAELALHHLLLSATGISFTLKPGSLENYTKIGESIIMENREEASNYAKSASDDFLTFDKKFLRLLEHFSKIYDQLIPVVSMRNTGSLDTIDREKYGIMTTNFDELMDFYAKSYELILDNLDIVIALNNVKYRKNYGNCLKGKDLKDLKQLRSKFKKIEFLDESEFFSVPTAFLKNTIRNSIQHFDSEIDYASQKITFTNTHMGRTRQDEMYLIDLAELCLENFSLLVYLQELVYNLKKLLFFEQGIVPTIFQNNRMNASNVKKSKKIPRNSPCPCGSGKKYKKCCGF